MYMVMTAQPTVQQIYSVLNIPRMRELD